MSDHLRLFRQILAAISLFVAPGLVSAQSGPCDCHHCSIALRQQRHFTIRDYNMHELSRASRSSTARHFNLQARNGDILDHTLWSHHFKDDLETNSSRLLPSGMALVERVARRKGYEPLELFVQQLTIKDTYQLDPTLDPRHPLWTDENANEIAALHQRIQQVNAARQAAVTAYSTNVLGRSREETIVLLHNPPRSGIPAAEASQAVGRMITEGPAGILPVMVTYPGFLGGK